MSDPLPKVSELIPRLLPSRSATDCPMTARERARFLTAVVEDLTKAFKEREADFPSEEFDSAVMKTDRFMGTLRYFQRLGTIGFRLEDWEELDRPKGGYPPISELIDGLLQGWNYRPTA